MKIKNETVYVIYHSSRTYGNVVCTLILIKTRAALEISCYHNAHRLCDDDSTTKPLDSPRHGIRAKTP